MSDSSSSGTKSPLIVSNSFIVNGLNKPLDVRAVVDTYTDIPNVPYPYEGLHIWVADTKKEYMVTTLSPFAVKELVYVQGNTGYNRKMVSSNTTAVNADWLICGGALTVTLPADTAGAYVRVSNKTYTVVIAPASGDNIESDTSGITLNLPNCTCELYGTGTGWVIAEM